MKLTKQYIKSLLPKRPREAHKGTFGKVVVVAGSENYPGAAYLACAACLRVGAGLVTLVTEQTVKIIVSKKLPEVTFLSPLEVMGKIGDYDILLIGPGIGQSDRIAKLMEQILSHDLPPTVIDGDGLNLLSKIDNWWGEFDGEIILTPHPGEMTRLTGLTIQTIQSDRMSVAQNFAKKWNQVVVLKGANTVIASPFGKIAVSPFANPALATAGTGDVLAGVISGMLTQGLKPFDAVCVGVFIHGLAGEILREKIGNVGALASDLLPLLPQVIKDL